MAEKTLADLGSNCTQDATVITLSKAALGLTGATNTLDQIIAAIAIRSKAVLTQANYDSEATQNLYVVDGFSSLTNKNNQPYRVDQITINLTKPDTGATLNAGDY